MSQKFISTFIGASLLLTFTGLLSKGLGFVREILYAANFGMSREFDVFLVSIALPTVINLSMIFICQNYFIPAYNREKAQNTHNERQFFSQNFYFFVLLGLLIYFFLLFFSESIINMYISSGDVGCRLLAKDLFQIFIITIPLNTVFAITTALLQAKYKFLPTAISNLLINIVIILGMIFLTGIYDIYIIPIAFVFGYLFQFFYVTWIVRKDIIWQFDFEQIKKIVRSFNLPLILTLGAEILSLSFVLVDRYFIGQVDEGGIGSLNYAYNLFFLPISIISLALSTVLLPKFSNVFSENDFKKLEKIFFDVIKVNIVVFSIVTLLFIIDGELLVKLVYERGAFNSNNTFVTTQVLLIFSFSFVFYSSFSLINKMFYSSFLVKELLYLTIASLALKTILNIVLVKEFQQNGLAISTLICYMFMFFGGLYIISFKLHFVQTPNCIKKIFFYTFIYIILYAFYSFIRIIIEINSLVDYLVISLFLSVLYFTTIIILKTDEVSLIEKIVNGTFNFKGIRRN